MVELMRSRIILLVIIFTSCMMHAADNASNIPHFTFYKMKTGEGLVSLVVAPSTTDKQLEALIHFIKDKVQQGRFADLGIKHPTDRRFGQLGYGAGIISVYRGPRCANEQFIDALGPCGYGEHDAASYQWGIGGNSTHSGTIRTKNGDLRELF